MATGTEKGVHNIMSKSDWTTALKDPSVLVLDCMATWCGPCKVVAPRIVKLSQQYENVRFYKMDVDELPDLAQELGVRAMPTFLVYKDGNKVEEIVGADDRRVEAAFKPLL